MARLSRPLNRNAVKAADNEFYANHPEFVKDGKRTPLSDTDPSQADLRKEWVALYKKHGGQVEDDKNKLPAKKPDDPVQPCPKQVKVSIKLSAPVVCPGHPLEISADGTPKGGTYYWFAAGGGAQKGGVQLVDKTGRLTVTAATVYLQISQPDYNPFPQNVIIVVSYTHPNGTASESKFVPILHIFLIDRLDGKAKQLSLADVQSKYTGKDLNQKITSNNYFILRGNSLVPTSSDTIDKINNPSKTDPLVKFCIEKLQSDTVSLNGQFPGDYYVTFGKAVFTEAIRQAPSDPDQGVDEAGKLLGSKVEEEPKVFPVYHIYESIVRLDDDTGYDKLQHYTRSAYLQYKYGKTVTDIMQYGKEIIFDEIPSWFDPNEKGYDDKDMLANNRGQAFGEELYKKYHPIRHKLFRTP